jgi:hypothetical protein
MSSPTLYFLTVEERWGAEGTLYFISEQHMCQERGCVKTEPEHLTICFSEHSTKEYIKCFESDLIEGVVEGVEWFKLPVIPRITDVLEVDAHGVYSNLTEMVLAICELSQLKPYEIVREDGQFAGYTFEVVE